MHRVRCLRIPKEIQRRRRNCTDGSVLVLRLFVIGSQAFTRRVPNAVRPFASPAREICWPRSRLLLDRTRTVYHFFSSEIKCDFRDFGECGWSGGVNAHSQPLSMRIEVKAASGYHNSPHPDVTIASIPMTTPCPSRWTPCRHRQEFLAAKSVPNRAVMAQKKCNLAL